MGPVKWHVVRDESTNNRMLHIEAMLENTIHGPLHLASPVHEAASDTCLRFWFRMTSDTDPLAFSVGYREENGTRIIGAITFDENESEAEGYAQVTLPGGKYKVLFTPLDWFGWLYLDDITVINGPCTPKGNFIFIFHTILQLMYKNLSWYWTTVDHCQK